ERPDWCTLTVDGSAACCMRIESPKRLRNGGWLHRLRDDDDWRGRPRVRRVILTTKHMSVADFGRLAEQYASAVTPSMLHALASRLGVAPEALARLRIGWDGSAWTFPMSDSAGRVTGIRRRFLDGRKLSVKGGHEGLFVPTDLPADGLVLIAEGPTDTAALLTLGFDAVGRPSCRGGVGLVCDLVRDRPAVIVADGDRPGQLGAEILAVALAAQCPSVRVIRPPSGINDARAWLRSGATARHVRAVIDAADSVHLGIKTKAASC
ncbi:MAG: hypothetical protein JXO22_14830, partial [Phycisphaerae bacterium]|nr:hypothetical protein [Phycisphaerae bacterium]